MANDDYKKSRAGFDCVDWLCFAYRQATGLGNTRFFEKIQPDNGGVEIFSKTGGLTLYSREEPENTFAPEQRLPEVSVEGE